MKALKVLKKDAEKARKTLTLKQSYKVRTGTKYVYFPVEDNLISENFGKAGKWQIIKVNKNFFQKRTRTGQKKLKDFLRKNKINIDFSSFEIIGDIAIIEIADKHKKYEKHIARGIMNVHPKIKTVLKKISAMQGIFRVRKVKHVLGERKTKTVYKENGCMFKLDVSKMFYSSKLANERLRIAMLVKKNEKVLVPFAGYGPFAILIAKKCPSSDVIGVELNSDAVKCFMENIKLNKLKNITVLHDDAGKIKFKQKFNRIVMPLPKNSVKYIKHMIPMLKSKGLVHVYIFTSKHEPYKTTERTIKSIAKSCRCKAKFKTKKIVRPYSPDIVEIVLDTEFEKC